MCQIPNFITWCQKWDHTYIYTHIHTYIHTYIYRFPCANRFPFFFVALLRLRKVFCDLWMHWMEALLLLISYVSLSFFSRPGRMPTDAGKRTWTWCYRLAQSVLIRSVIQTAVGQTDRIHHWILTRTFLSIFSICSILLKCARKCSFLTTRFN